MDARSVRTRTLWVVALALGAITPSTSQSAYFATTNFQVHAPTAALAREIAEKAEYWRRELAIEWIGKEMPPWAKPCPIKAQVAPRLGAGGMTTFVFDRGQVFNWNMTVQGSRERVLDSVLPHEVTHTIFACYFRQPLPRWADEGACTTVEHTSEIAKQERLLIQFLKTGKGISFQRMFEMKEYPPDVMPLYAQGHSLTRYLIGQHGKAKFLDFLGDGMEDENWPRAVRQHYGHDSLMALQVEWLDWVRQGRPKLAGEMQSGRSGSNVGLAAHASPSAASRGNVRSQSPDPTSKSTVAHESAYSQLAKKNQRSKAAATTTASDRPARPQPLIRR